jgi:hypothetical protein
MFRLSVPCSSMEIRLMHWPAYEAMWVPRLRWWRPAPTERTCTGAQDVLWISLDTRRRSWRLRLVRMPASRT